MVDKRRVEPESRELRALQTELQAYQIIADSEPSRFVMDCHGVFQDEGCVYFAMVSGRTQIAVAFVYVTNGIVTV